MFAEPANASQDFEGDAAPITCQNEFSPDVGYVPGKTAGPSRRGGAVFIVLYQLEVRRCVWAWKAAGGESELVIMIGVATEETNGSDRIPDLK